MTFLHYSRRNRQRPCGSTRGNSEGELLIQSPEDIEASALIKPQLAAI
jgi:hypothetical protein